MDQLIADLAAQAITRHDRISEDICTEFYRQVKGMVATFEIKRSGLLDHAYTRISLTAAISGSALNRGVSVLPVQTYRELSPDRLCVPIRNP